MNPITSEHSGLPNSSGRNLRNDDELVSHKSQNELVSPESPLHDQSGSDVHDNLSGSEVHDPSGSNVQNPTRN